jgi:hypothetical protein
MSYLYAANTVAAFWKLQIDLPAGLLEEAIQRAAPLLPDGTKALGCGAWTDLMAYVLREGHFGPAHWRLSAPKRLYYLIKPMVPRTVTCVLRRLYGKPSRGLCFSRDCVISKVGGYQDTINLFIFWRYISKSCQRF